MLSLFSISVGPQADADVLGVQVPWSGVQWEVAVGCGGLKGSRADWLVEKCTELGARSLRPLLCERSSVVGALPSSPVLWVCRTSPHGPCSVQDSHTACRTACTAARA